MEDETDRAILLYGLSSEAGKSKEGGSFLIDFLRLCECFPGIIELFLIFEFDKPIS